MLSTLDVARRGLSCRVAPVVSSVDTVLECITFYIFTNRIIIFFNPCVMFVSVEPFFSAC